MIGTTHFTNAVVQRRDLEPRGRGAHRPAGQRLAAAVRRLAGGPGRPGARRGRHARGRPRVRRPADRAVRRQAACATAARRIRDAGITSVAIASVFSPLNADVRGRRRRRSCARSVPTSRSRCRTGSAASACSSARTRRCSTPAWSSWRGGRRAAFTEALRRERHRGAALPHPERRHGDAGRGRRGLSRSTASRPARPTACAAPRSSRGASDAIVIDVGGTTTDIGSLRHGFPREANNVVEVGGVRTLFRMPDLLSLGLGRRHAGGASDGAARRARAASAIRLTEQALRVRRRRPHRHRRRGRRRPDRSRRPRARGRPARPALVERRRSRASTR